MEIRAENPFDLLTSPGCGERVLFTASVCPTKPLSSVKTYLGPHDDVLTLCPGLQEDWESARLSGIIYHMVMGTKYTQIGALQIETQYPMWHPNKDLTRASLEVMYATSSLWSQTHLICSTALGQGKVVEGMLPLLSECPLGITLWTGDLSLMGGV